MTNEQTQTFQVKILDRLPDSVRVEHNGHKCFLPRSQIERLEIDAAGKRGTVTIPTWLYEKEFGEWRSGS